MNRDILENLLQDKLSEMSVNPPTGMWEKLESGLAAAGAIGAGLGAGSILADGAASGVSAAASQGGASAAATTTATSAAGAGGGGLGGAAVGGIVAGVAATATIVGVVLYDGESDAPIEIPEPVIEVVEEIEPTPIFEEIEVEIEPGRYIAVAVPATAPLIEIAPAGVAVVEPDPAPAVDIMPRKAQPTVQFVPPVIEPKKRPVSLSLYASTAGLKFGGDKHFGLEPNFSVTEMLEGPGGALEMNNFAVPLTQLKHHMPLSLGLNVDVQLKDRLWLSSGVFYTHLKSEANGFGAKDIEYEFNQELHYIGVPVWLRYDIARKNKFLLYAGAGVNFEKLIDSKQTLSFRHPSAVFARQEIERGLSRKGIQTSVGLNLGAQWNLSNRLGLYFEPGLSYYIENSDQPMSYRTENPFNVTLKAGLRIKLVK